MDLKVYPSKLHGFVEAIPSKSMAHRILICAAFADKSTRIQCGSLSEDIEATVECLRALGTHIIRADDDYIVTPASSIPAHAELCCRESGATFRFMLPIVCALGIDTVFHMEGRLPARPLSPLWEELERMGCSLTRPTADTVRVRGKLQSGVFKIPGNITSQFVSGLLMALPLLEGSSQICITTELESKPYVDLTRYAMSIFGITFCDNLMPCGHRYISPGYIKVEGDWSSAAFFVTAKHLGSDVEIRGLSQNSLQGDRAIASIYKEMPPKPEISVKNIPDLVPILSVYFAAGNGVVFTDAQRLRLKESDRIASVINMLKSLGGKAEYDGESLRIYGTGLHGGIVNTYHDHRIAMAAAIAATVADGPITILGAECVAKSYPTFWQDFSRLGGKYEQYIR